MVFFRDNRMPAMLSIATGRRASGGCKRARSQVHGINNAVKYDARNTSQCIAGSSYGSRQAVPVLGARVSIRRLPYKESIYVVKVTGNMSWKAASGFRDQWGLCRTQKVEAES